MRWYVLLFIFLSCQSQDSEKSKVVENIVDRVEKPMIDYDQNEWMEISTDSTGILLDIQYATDANFTKQTIYPCARCFVRPALGKKLIRIQNDIQKRYQLGLKIFDGYRPRPAQQRLWDIVPDPSYVTDPQKGSMHNRGLAVDITLVDHDGIELDMGTNYDYFGKEAHHTYQNLNKTILKNRRFLKKLMELHGLKSIRTEWWHYSLVTENAALSDWEWECK